MSINLPSLLRLTLAGAVVISVGACKPSDKGQGALKSEGIKALNLSKSESQVFAKYFETEPCEVDERESLGALAGLGLGEDGVNGVSFKSRDVNEGVVTFSDLTMTEDGTEKAAFSAKSIVFHCPKMGEDAPIFDRVDFTDIFIYDPEDDVEITAKTLNIASPTSTGARSIVESITKPGGSDMDPAFGAISITDVKMTSDDMNGTLASLSFGESPDENGREKADVTLDDLDFKLSDPAGNNDMTLTFKGMSIRNFYMGDQDLDTAALSPNEVMASVLGNLSPFEKPYDEMLVEPLKFDSAFFSADIEGMEGKTTEKSGVGTTRQSLKPMKFSLKPAAGDVPEMAQAYELAKSLGLETIEMSGSSVTKVNEGDDSIAVSDGLFVIEDLMRLNYEYEADGLSEMSAKMQTLTASDPGADPTAAYGELNLRNFRMTLEDNSLVERGLKLGSEMTGMPVTTIKLSMGMLVLGAGSIAENEVQAEVISETMSAFADFVNKGGTLTIEANPPAPFSLGSLVGAGGEDVDPASLGFSASQAGKTE